jgi:site-specific DNA-methyltransferase (adenine-specific)
MNTPITTQIIAGDCLDQLSQFKADTFDLIVTSPPYADQRKNTYGGIKPDQYVQWFAERSKQFLRVLKPTGTFILNIKEKVEKGERHVYVLELIIELRKQGWLWTEEYIWHKRNCHPGKWPNRFRDAWERCLQFNKTRNFKMFQDQVMVPMGDWRHARLKNLSETDKRRDDSKVQSGFGKNISNWIGREMAYPTNVLHFATECANKNHSATFPKALPEWFIKLFTQPGDWVLDPFSGSGTTNLVAQGLGRNSLGIDKEEQNVILAQKYLSETKWTPNANRSNGHNGIRNGKHSGLSHSKAGKIKGASLVESDLTQKSLFAES